MRRVLLGLLLAAGAAFAGGGPETTLVVVNARSPVSRLVANEYVRLRDIPPSHVVYLDRVPRLGVIPLDQFLERIWTPVQAFLDERGLADAIDLITYSADFPYAVDFRKVHEGQSGTGRHASLTGLTYLIRHVRAEADFWDLQINRYFRVSAQVRGLSDAERAHWSAAQAAAGRQAWGEAEAAYRKVLATHERHPLVWYKLGACLARLGRAQPALEALGKAAEYGFNRPNQAANDPDLVPLRSRSGFKAVLERMQGATTPVSLRPTRAFRSTLAWTRGGEVEDRPDSSDRYYLSTQLAYTGRFGNSAPETLAYLRAAAGADGTRPDGTVYILKNGDVRSRAREPFFAATIARLKELGRKVELRDGVLPTGKDDVVGAVVGKAGFSWAKSGSRLLPGAIAEHLTSYGAHFGTAGQTKCTEFLRHGAAGSSGTVQEPLALFQKFPVPMIHCFYAEGCSLAEAFFQSVWGPYQLMVIGDGLARPFARFADVAVDAPDGPWRGTVALEGEVWVDGRPVAALDTAAFDDGVHDVRVVRVANDAVATRSYRRIDAVFANHGHTAKVAHAPGVVTMTAAGARSFELWAGARRIAESADGRLGYDAASLGPGPVALVARAVFPDGTAYRAAPIAFDVAPPALRAAAKKPEGELRAGVSGHWTDAAGKRHARLAPRVGDRHGGRLLRDLLPAGKGGELVLAGWVEVAQDGFYQLAVSGAGTLTLELGGPVCEDLALEDQAFLPVGLAAGWHPFRLALVARGRPHVEVMLGGAVVLGDLKLFHAAGPAATIAKASDPALVDGKQGKKGVAAEAYVVTLKKTARDVAALTLHGTEFPDAWVVETNTGYGKFKPVEGLETVAMPPARVAKGKPAVPVYVELRFEPRRARKIRLRPQGKAAVTEIEVLRKG